MERERDKEREGGGGGVGMEERKNRTKTLAQRKAQVIGDYKEKGAKAYF